MADKDVVEGKIKQVEGRLQDAVGDLTGDARQDARGKAKQVEGKIQEGYGHLKDEARKEPVDRS